MILARVDTSNALTRDTVGCIKLDYDFFHCASLVELVQLKKRPAVSMT